MIVTDSPTDIDEAFLAEQLNKYNDLHREKDGKRLSIYIKDKDGNVVAGLSAITF